MRRLLNSPIALLTLAFVLMAIAELSSLHWLQPLENRVSDYLVRTHALTLKADPEILIVDIDEKSLASMSDSAGSWPWPRSVHGELVEAIERQQPKAIVFDILFTDPDIYRPESDAYFNEVVARHHNIYFPMIRLDPVNDRKGVPITEIAALTGMEATPVADQNARVALAPPHAISPDSWRLGAINYDEDSDGIGRRYHIYLPASGWRIPSLPTRLARDMGFDIPPGDKIILGWRGGPLSHPHIPYADLYLDASRKTPLRSQHELKDKIVIIGASASGLHDIRSTPVSSLHPAQEILATAIDNLKNHGFFHAVPSYVAPALALSLIGLLSLLFVRYHQTLHIGAALLGITAILLGISHFAVSQRWLVPVFLPLLFAWGFYFAAALHEYLRERKAREQTIQMFNRFLDPRVVHELVDQGKTAQSMSGQTQTVTVLFSDIRNFTTYSEQHSAEQVVAMLNRYFSLQVEVIFRHGGTLDKFIGDAIMAFWGAPASDPQHATNAVAAALEMAQRLEEFKHELGEAGSAFDVGIGIHSGPAVVGFIGSERRQDYTAIGDTVNLSSRIEGQTKGVARILVSDETRALCADKFDFIDHGFYKVKGRAQETHLFEPRRKAA